GLRVFHELGPDLYSASSHTFIGRVYARLGMADIADRAASKAGSRYPKLSPEYVVSADPDLIVLADKACCDVTPKVVRGRPGWSEISAVQHDSVITVNKDVSSRWGPRLPRFVATVVRAMKEVQAPAGNAP
ncbi:MAG: ABC transporter substrate-binding protein, partial [Nocardioidaceae bacterium]